MDWPEVSIRFKPFKMADDIQRKSFLFQLNQAGKVSDTSLLAEADYDQEEENKLILQEDKERLQVLKDQQIAQAEAQGEAQIVSMKYQAKAQQIMAAMQQTMQNEQAQAQMQQQGQPEATGQNGQVQNQVEQVQQQQQQVQTAIPAQSMSPLSMSNNLAGSMGIDLAMLARQHAQTIASMPPQQRQAAINALYASNQDLASMVIQILQMMDTEPMQAGIDSRPLPEQRPPRRKLSTI